MDTLCSAVSPNIQSWLTARVSSEALSIPRSGAPLQASAGGLTGDTKAQRKTSEQQGRESEQFIKHQLYVFNSSPLLANLPKNIGCGGLLLGPWTGHRSEFK